VTELPARVLILGLGFSGRAIARQLQARGIDVSGTVRNPQAAPADGLQRHRLHEDLPPDAALCSALATAEAVICCVPPDAGGDPALRRVQSHLQASTALRWVGCLSSTGVYADRQGGWVNQDSAADAAGPVAVQRRLAEAQWQAFARGRGIASAVFRLPGLYGRGRNALVQLAEGRARHVVRPGLVFNRLHVEDVAGVVLAALARPEPEAVYLPSDDLPAPSQDVLAYAAALSGWPMPPALAWDDPSLSPALRRFYAGSKRIDSRQTRARLHWRPRFPSYREGLADAWAAGDGAGAASVQAG